MLGCLPGIPSSTQKLLPFCAPDLLLPYIACPVNNKDIHVVFNSNFDLRVKINLWSSGSLLACYQILLVLSSKYLLNPFPSILSLMPPPQFRVSLLLTLDQCFSNSSMCQNHTKRLQKHRFLGPTPRDSDSVGLG